MGCLEHAWLLSQHGSIHRVRFHQCMFFLRPPDYDGRKDLRTRKDTVLVSNIPELSSLSRRCDNHHHHIHAIGTCHVQGRGVKRAAAAGCYPKALCTAWARAVALHFLQ